MSRRSPFGWSYPAGAENDPEAPYNQVEPPDCCPFCNGASSDDDKIEPFCSDECQDRYNIALEEQRVD